MKWVYRTDMGGSASCRLQTGVAAAAVLLLACLPAAAQDRLTVETLDQRLQRVERVLDQSLFGLVKRIDDLQAELRELRGEIERLDHELATLKRRNRDLYADTDRRVSDLEDALAGEGAFDSLDALDGDALRGDTDELDELDAQNEPGERSQQDDAQSDDVAAVIVPEGAGSTAEDKGADTDRSALVQVRRTATAAEQRAYTEAYDLLASGDNEAAVTAFQEFIDTYPDGPYTDNAWYWLGEGMYAQRNFAEALDSFGQVVEKFPSSPKVPDARLKIGFTLYEQREYGDARSMLLGVQNDYPNRSASVLARKRLQQMDRDGL